MLNQIFQKNNTSNCLYVYHHIFCADYSQEESLKNLEIIPLARVVQCLSYQLTPPSEREREKHITESALRFSLNVSVMFPVFPETGNSEF